MTAKVNQTIVPAAQSHGVTAPPTNHSYWPVVRLSDGVEVDRVADYATAVARAKEISAQHARLGLPV